MLIYLVIFLLSILFLQISAFICSTSPFRSALRDHPIKTEYYPLPWTLSHLSALLFSVALIISLFRVLRLCFIQYAVLGKLLVLNKYLVSKWINLSTHLNIYMTYMAIFPLHSSRNHKKWLCKLNPWKAILIINGETFFCDLSNVLLKH